MIGAVPGPEDVGVDPPEPTGSLRVQQQDIQLEAADAIPEHTPGQTGEVVEAGPRRGLCRRVLLADRDEVDLVAARGEPPAEPPQVPLLPRFGPVGAPDLDADP